MIDIGKALAIAGVNLRRLLRDRSNIFFVLLFPMLLILVIGAAFGGGFSPRLGVVVTEPGPLSDRLVAELRVDESFTVRRLADAAALRTAVERGEIAGGVIVPAGYDEILRDGGEVDLRYLSRPDEYGQQVSLAVRGALAREAALLRAAGFVAAETGQDFDAALATAESVAGGIPPVSVEATTVGQALFPASLGRFDTGASSQLLLFVFLTSLVGATALIETRRLGVSRRMLATATGAGTILAGEALGRVAVALVQGLVIMLGAGLLFGVNWGDPLAAGALLLAFALVASGAAMVLGGVLRTEQQAGGLGILLGLALGALGGSMMPAELFSDAMRTVSRVTPHAWANEGFAELVRRGGGLPDIAVQLGVLFGYAAVLFLLGTWLLRRTLTR